MAQNSQTAFEEMLTCCYHDAQVGHGEHWRIFFDDLSILDNLLPKIGLASQPMIACADDVSSCPLPFPETEPTGDLVVWPNPDRGILQIHTQKNARGEKTIVSAYPWLTDGVSHMARLEAICLWPERLEAHLQAWIHEGLTVTFFDPLFAKNRVLYRKGGFYPVVFSAFAYVFRVYDLSQIADAETKLDFRDTSCRLVQDGVSPDDYAFMGKVVDVKTIRFFDSPVTLARVTVGRIMLPFDEPFDIDIVVTDGALGLSRSPDIGDTVYGRLWLVGHLSSQR